MTQPNQVTDGVTIRPSIDSFFALARERQAIYLKRVAGSPPPWTKDEILRQYRFTNVFRENDRTTRWFREHVRDPTRDKPEVLLATVVFRLFNRVTTGEAIFLQGFLDDGRSAWGKFLADRDLDVLRTAILTYCGRGPYVTGAFMVKTPAGMSKLDGVLWIVEQFVEGNWRDTAMRTMELNKRQGQELFHVWAWLRQFPYIGDFQAYEIVTDLRHTALLNRAPDVDTWASAGPGARKGLAYIYGECRGREWQIAKMRELLELSRRPEYWPQHSWNRNHTHKAVRSEWNPGEFLEWEHWPLWELREVEMWLCECAKYWRVAEGGHRPKQRFKP